MKSRRITGVAWMIGVCWLLGGLPAHAAWPTDPSVNVALCTETGGQSTTSGSAVGDGAGGAIVAWVDVRDGNSDIYAQRVNARGETQWATDGVAVCTAAGSQEAVQAVSDGAGGAILVWLDSRGADADYYAQRVNGAGELQWPPAFPSTDGVTLCTVAGIQQDLVMVVDDAGGVIAAWRHDAPVDDGVFAQRLDPSGNIMWPVGAPSPDGVTVCATDGAQQWPGIAADGAGGVVVAWTDGRDSATTRSDIYAQRLDASGAAMWTLHGVPLCQADLGQTYPMVAGDGAGGAIVAWEDYRVVGSGQGLYAQRVSSTGTTLWTGDGIEICDTYSGGDDNLDVLSDGAGGAYLVWTDVRNAVTTGLDLFAQRISPSGSELWTAGGAVVSAAPDKQQTFDSVADAARGVIVSWTDFRDDTFTDIYAQYLDASGVAAGPVDGLATCTAYSSQFHSSLAGDGAGGAIVAWYDFRDNAVSGSDVYAQAVFSQGLLFEDGFESGDTAAWSAVVP